MATDVSATHEGLPVNTLREAAPYLRRPFTPEAVKFKVQTVFKDAKGCLIVGYIDARLVIERLNAVIPDKWSAKFRPLDGTKLMECQLTVDGISRVDVGESPKGLSKDLYSDALKRAAVQFGVGVSIYAVPQIKAFLDDSGKLEKRQQGGKDTLVITPEGHRRLREGYRTWLQSVGEARFGPALDHGDTEGEEIDVEAEADGFTPEPAPALTDEKAEMLLGDIDRAYDTIRSIDPQAIPPGQFNAWRQAAAHSHAELERLLAHLIRRGEEIAGVAV